jgi:hypothetical protein
MTPDTSAQAASMYAVAYTIGASGTSQPRRIGPFGFLYAESIAPSGQPEIAAEPHALHAASVSEPASAGRTRRNASRCARRRIRARASTARGRVARELARRSRTYHVRAAASICARRGTSSRSTCATSSTATTCSRSSKTRARSGTTCAFRPGVRLSLPLRAWSEIGFIEHLNLEDPPLWIFYGLMLVMAVYNLFVYASVRDTAAGRKTTRSTSTTAERA